MSEDELTPQPASGIDYRSHSCAPGCAEHPFSSGYDWSAAIRSVAPYDLRPMASDGGLVAWLRAVIEADRDDAAHRLRLSRMSAAHRGRLMEKADRAKAELAILVTHHGEDLEEDLEDGDYRVRTVCTRCDGGYYPCRTVRLLGSGYRRRDGYRQEWAP